MKASADSDSALQPFVRKHQGDIIGVLRGFDRLRLAGTFRALYHPPVMEMYIKRAGFLMKDFKQLMLQVTGQIKAASQQIAQKMGRPLLYLSSSQVRKEQLARQIAQKDGGQRGLIAILRCVEPCRTYTVGGNPKTKMLEAQLGLGKCLHHYFYHLHPVFGFMHLRLQTWFPFLGNVCVNGRNWLAQQMTSLGMRFQQWDNCFIRIDDVAQAQRLMDEQLNTRWVVELERLVLENHPSHAANERYLSALAVVEDKMPLSQGAQSICQPLRKDGQRYRGLNPWSQEDARILEAVNRGEFAINGFGNRDLRARLYSGPVSQSERKRRAGVVTRKLRLLRAHGLIGKVSGTHRYVVTEKGRRIITALMSARQANIQKLTALAV